MSLPVSKHCINRRQFLTKGVVSCTSLCLGCSFLASLAAAQDVRKDKSFQAKVTENSNMSFEQVFNFAFRDSLAPQLIALSRQIGRDKLIEMLKNTTDEVWFQTDIQKRFDANLPKGFWSHVLDLEVLQDTPDVQIYKVTKCLWATTFREAGAADIGYALWCYGDYAIARSKEELLERNSTLMQGHDFCLLKYTKKV
jgi:hypothetical protein